MAINCRWLGVAGLEFSLDGYTLLIDPFFTRPSRLDVLAGRRVTPDRAAVARHVSRADAVLVTHPHYDHLLDVPEVLRLTGARAYGSPNTVTLLKLHGWEAGTVHSGDRLNLGPFAVEVFPALHTRLLFGRLLNGPLPRSLRLPLRLSDYRMDACYSFCITADGWVMLVGNHPIPADWVFISPYQSDHKLAETLRAIQPRVIAPVHWEDFMRPLNLPLRPMLLTPVQGGRRFPPVQRVELNTFVKMAREIVPGARVFRMELFRSFEISG